MSLIYKICTEAEWENAIQRNRFPGSEIDRRDGFIHFSDQAQVAETARRHFAGVKDLVLVEVEGDRFGDDLKWEESRGGEKFPHLYGPFPLTAVLRVEPAPLGEDGTHNFPFIDE